MKYINTFPFSPLKITAKWIKLGEVDTQTILYISVLFKVELHVLKSVIAIFFIIITIKSFFSSNTGQAHIKLFILNLRKKTTVNFTILTLADVQSSLISFISYQLFY